MIGRCELRDPAGGTVSDIAWNPDQGLHLVTASGDDKNPVLKLWDLRSSTSLPLATLSGHSEGILSVSWCPSDTSLLMSCGKDNRTILWDLFNLQAVYELPFKEAESSAIHSMYGQHNDASSGGVFGGLASSASHRRYHVAWAPGVPAVASASSFDRKVQFFSLTGARTKNGRAPKWLRKPVGACFGFGGKLVTIENVQTSAPANNSKKGAHFGRLKIHQVAENPELTTSSDFFHEYYTKGMFKEYCEIKSARDDASTSQPVWSLMNVICYGKNPREELLTYLGFDSATITATAQAYLASKQPAVASSVPSTVDGQLASSLSAQLTFDSNANAADVFGSEPGSPVPTAVETTYPAASVTSPVVSEEPASPAQSAKVAELLSIVRAGEAAEPTILNAIIVGNFELAVDCCLSAGLLAEALLLSQCGDADLRARTQAAYFEKQRSKFPFLNVLHAVIKSQLMDFVVQSDLSRWRETMAMLSTYGKSEEFPALCQALASRLEHEISDRRSATLCYMCAADVGRVVQFWTEELDEANMRLGKVDTLALQDYVEKILIFTQANPVEKLPVECGRYFASYAELLANQGRLTQAMTYLKGDAQPVAILVDRLYHAGNKPPGSRPPTFPFHRLQVDANVVAANAAATNKGTVVGANTAANVFGSSSSSAAVGKSSVTPTAGANTLNRTAAVASTVTNPYQPQVVHQQQQPQQQQQQQLAQTQTQQVAPLPAAPAAPKAPSLPPGWLQLLDPASNLYYYVNQATGQSQWEPPAMVPEVIAPPAAPAANPQFAQPQQFEQHQHQQFQQQQQQQASPKRPMVQQDIAFPNAAAANPALISSATAPVAASDASSGATVAAIDHDSVIALGQMIESIAGMLRLTVVANEISP